MLKVSVNTFTMDKRDPLREVGNHTSENNENHEEAKEPKIPENVPPSEKENGGVVAPNTDPEKAGCGKLRLSFLKAFDPLYSESPGKSDVSPKPERKRPQLIIEDSDSDHSCASPVPVDVSDDDAAFVDATYIANSDDENKGDPETPKPKQALDESLLKFYTPRKFNTTTSEPIKKSVLSEDKEIESTSVANRSVEENKSSDSEQQQVHSTTGDISEHKEFVSDKSDSDLEEQVVPAKSEPDNKEQDNSAASEVEGIVAGDVAGNISDSTYSEVSEIKTDTPEKSRDSSEIELDDSGEYCSAKGVKSDTSASPEPARKFEKVSSSDDTRETSESLLSRSSDSGDKDVVKPRPGGAGDAGISGVVLPRVAHVDTDSDDEYPGSVVEHLVNGIYTSESFSTSGDTSENLNRNSLVENAIPVEEKVVAEDKKESGQGESSKVPQVPYERVEEQETSDTVSSFHSDEESIKENLELLEKHTADTSFEEGQYEEENAKQIFESYIDDGDEEIAKEDSPVGSPQKEERLDPEPVIDDTKPAEEVVDEIKKEEENLDVTVDASKPVDQSTEQPLESGESPKAVPEETKSATVEDSGKVKEEENLSGKVESRSPDPLEDNSTVNAHQDEEQHLDSGVDSIEESYTKSPKSSVGELEAGNASENKEDGSLPDDDVLEEPKVEPDSHVTSDDDSKTIVSEGSVKSEQILTDTNTSNLPDSSESEEITEVEVKLEDTSKPDADNTVFDAGFYKAKMADLSERLSEQQQENSDLKLQLNASQQAKASLELEIRQKEEIIIKTQAEALKNEQMYKQEIKQLREKLKENSKLIEKDGSKELEEQLKEARAREAKAVAELNQKTKDDLNYQKIMEEYENTIATRFADYQKLKEEHETATRHLANIELAFSDVHQKYERTKALLEGFKSNEETLSQSLQASEKTCKQHEERYELLKAHAKAQIEKSNKEILTLRDKYDTDMNKLRAIIKRLEIKCSSLEVSLQQKTEECAALSALCDEVTGKKV